MPDPIPALPDAERVRSYTLSSQEGPFDVGFGIYADNTDYGSWIEVWLDGVMLTPATDWVLTVRSGPLDLAPMPLLDAQITLMGARSGTLTIVGARRPRRNVQFPENQGVTNRSQNQVFTDLVAQNRERWDAMGRTMRVPPGDHLPVLPRAVRRANGYLGFDGGGDPIVLPGSPAVLPPITSYLALSQFTEYEDPYRNVQAAFDAASESGRLLVGDTGVQLLEGPVYVNDGLHYRGEGTVFRRLLIDTASGVGTIQSFDWEAGNYINDVLLENLWIDDPDNTRIGNFLTLKANKLRLVRPRLKKLSPHSVSIISGTDIEIVQPWIDSYDASYPGTPPEGQQTWCDSLTFTSVVNLRIVAPQIRSQDDCIVFTMHPPDWAPMTGNPISVSANINSIGGILQSKVGVWVRMGIDTDANSLPEWGYLNAQFGGFVGYVDESAGLRSGGIGIHDYRTTPTASIDGIEVHDVRCVVNTDAGSEDPGEMFYIRGAVDTSSSNRNIGRLALRNIDLREGGNSSGYLGSIRGVRDLVLEGFRTTPDGGKSASNGLDIDNIGRLSLADNAIRLKATNAAVVASRYDTLIAHDNVIGGGDAAGLLLDPNDAANLDVKGLRIEDAGAPISLQNTYGDHAKIEIANLTRSGLVSDALVAALALPAGDWIDYDPTVEATSGSIGGHTTTVFRYRKAGKKVEFHFTITITDNGTAAEFLKIGLPIAPAWRSVATGKEDVHSGKQLFGWIIAGDAHVYVANYDASYPAVTGSVIDMWGDYPVA